jgi:pimeloyl-ACP methyl ester carboxylesterase
VRFLAAWRLPRRLHLRSWVALSLAVSCVACEPLRQWGADAIVRAPNRGALAPERHEGELFVTVGPPAAALSLEIVDAKVAPRGTVFLLHGIRADRSQVRGWARMLADAGFRAVLVDLRGHGRSTGDWLSYGVVESTDLAQALDALLERGLVAGRVGVMGFSYGAAIAIEWAGQDTRIAAVVAVAPFASLRAVVPGYAPLFPASFVESAIDVAGRQAGFNPDEASPTKAIRRTSAPVLVIHGEDDGSIPPWHSRQICAAGGDHAELLMVPGEGHRSIVDAALVRGRSSEWFGRHLLPAESSVPEAELERHESSHARVVGDARAVVGRLP